MLTCIVPAPPVAVITQPPTNSDAGGLSKAAIIGISVPIICSVLGLVVGLWIKWHWSRKAAKTG